DALSLVVYYFSLLSLFSHPATTAIYTLSLHDALPIFVGALLAEPAVEMQFVAGAARRIGVEYLVVTSLGTFPMFGLMQCTASMRSEEHTSELQSRENLVCRLLLEKKKQNKTNGKKT